MHKNRKQTFFLILILIIMGTSYKAWARHYHGYNDGFNIGFGFGYGFGYDPYYYSPYYSGFPYYGYYPPTRVVYVNDSEPRRDLREAFARKEYLSAKEYRLLNEDLEKSAYHDKKSKKRKSRPEFSGRELHNAFVQHRKLTDDEYEKLRADIKAAEEKEEE